jgi:hypothetical protein
VVHAFEQHIDMAVTDVMKHCDDRITAMQTVLETKLDSGLKSIDARLTGMQTSIGVLKWAIIVQGTLLVIVATVTGFIKLIH